MVVASPHPFPPYEHEGVLRQQHWRFNASLNWASMRWGLTKDRTRIRLPSYGPLPWTRVDEASKQSKGAGKADWRGNESAEWGEGHVGGLVVYLYTPFANVVGIYGV